METQGVKTQLFPAAVIRRVCYLSWYPRGMNTDGNISAICRGCVIFVLLPEECTDYVKMSTGFLTWLWVIPFKKIKNVQSQHATIIQDGHIERIAVCVCVCLNFYFYFILLYNTVLVLPYINMNPHGCTCIPKHEPPSHLPPHNISLGHPCAPAPSMLYPASDIDWWFDSYMIVYMFQCHSPKSSHPLPLSPKDCSIHLCLFCCLAYRVIITIFLNSIYMC